MTTTNVMRILTKAGIPFTHAEYEVDESDLSGAHAAAAMGRVCAFVVFFMLRRRWAWIPTACSRRWWRRATKTG